MRHRLCNQCNQAIDYGPSCGCDYQAGRQDERDATIDWLRRNCPTNMEADAVERGEHIPRKPNG